MDGLMKRILKISRAVAVGANIGLEHLVFIEGRLSVCLTPPNYLSALPGWHRQAWSSLSASQQEVWDKPICSQNPGLEPIVHRAVSSKPSVPGVLYDRSVREHPGFTVLYTDELAPPGMV